MVAVLDSPNDRVRLAAASDILDLDTLQAALREHMRTNVDAVLDVTLEAARTFWREGPRMHQRRAHVVCFAPARIPLGRGAGLYATSMGALRALVDHLRAELAIIGVDVDLFPDVETFAARENASRAHPIQAPA